MFEIIITPITTVLRNKIWIENCVVKIPSNIHITIFSASNCRSPCQRLIRYVEFVLATKRASHTFESKGFLHLVRVVARTRLLLSAATTLVVYSRENAYLPFSILHYRVRRSFPTLSSRRVLRPHRRLPFPSYFSTPIPKTIPMSAVRYIPRSDALHPFNFYKIQAISYSVELSGLRRLYDEPPRILSGLPPRFGHRSEPSLEDRFCLRCTWTRAVSRRGGSNK